MEVFFYLPEKYLPSPDRQAAWKAGRLTSVETGGKAASAQAWIFQTWVELERSGFPTRLVHEIPAAGVMITLTGFLDPKWSAPQLLFIAGIAADATPHPAASLHILQNSLHTTRLRNAVFMPHWPQPGLLPRESARGDTFENLCFLGDEKNLAEELRSAEWAGQLKAQTGLTLTRREAPVWHDYRDIDCVVAIRSVGSSPQFRKPATKLYNAWLAGVPFIGGTDSAYRGDGRPGVDYLIAKDSDDVIAQISRLQADPAKRRSIVEAGRDRSALFTVPAIAKRWRNLLERTIPRFMESDLKRSKFQRSLHHLTNRLGVAWDCRTRS